MALPIPCLPHNPMQITEPVSGVLINWCFQRKYLKCFFLVWFEGKTVPILPWHCRDGP